MVLERSDLILTLLLRVARLFERRGRFRSLREQLVALFAD